MKFTPKEFSDEFYRRQNESVPVSEMAAEYVNAKLTRLGDRVFQTFVPNNYGGDGVSKRELFSAMAMQGFISALVELLPGDKDSDVDGKMIAEFSVDAADCLIEKLDKTTPGADGWTKEESKEFHDAEKCL